VLTNEMCITNDKFGIKAPIKLQDPDAPVFQTSVSHLKILGTRRTK